jgi:hypothetical protein
MLPAVDEGFFQSAPVRFAETMEIGLPAQTVWAELTRDKTLDWCRGLQITWLSPRPFGVGTNRQAKLFSVVLAVREQYFLWEEGRRKAFFVTGVMPPVYRRSAEDYLVEPLGLLGVLHLVFVGSAASGSSGPLCRLREAAYAACLVGQQVLDLAFDAAQVVIF